jgi:hypothetical protein
VLPYPTAPYFAEIVAHRSCRLASSFLHLQRSPHHHPTANLCRVSHPTARFFDQKCGAYILPINFVIFAFATIPPVVTRLAISVG